MSHTILIADDSLFIREALCNLFEREEDFDVCGEAKNGREAVDKAQELHPDLILLDHSMPVINGLDATRVLKRMMPEVPVIMFSAYCGSSTEKEARSTGASALVSKFEHIFEHISVLLSKARLALEPQQLRAFRPLSASSRRW
jgi:DNA-binding NarL/FixJ family response regulator